jgi:hypothetical protein
MHRSATSLLGKGLYKSNVHMGDNLLGAMPSNIYGHFEDIDFIKFNDSILREAGGSWDKPPSRKKILEVGKKHKKQIESFIRSKQRGPFWGWKDPRTVLTIECYLPYLENPHFIACFRNPIEVAESLHKRDGKPINEGIKLANIYNKRLLEFLAKWVEIEGDD